MKRYQREAQERVVEEAQRVTDGWYAIPAADVEGVILSPDAGEFLHGIEELDEALMNHKLAQKGIVG